jgi:hypothetical protein
VDRGGIELGSDDRARPLLWLIWSTNNPANLSVGLCAFFSAQKRGVEGNDFRPVGPKLWISPMRQHWVHRAVYHSEPREGRHSSLLLTTRSMFTPACLTIRDLSLD